MRIFFLSVVLFSPFPVFAADPDPTKVFGPGEKCPDSRLGKPKDLNVYFPFKPPADKKSWNDRARSVREQLLVATGLWPLPEKTPLNAVIHGKIERDGYIVETTPSGQELTAVNTGAGEGGQLLGPRLKAAGATCAVALSRERP